MAYEVLARKWRPQRFSELVGQEHISKTLKNAIATQRVAHAYLFVGSRGIGKTTSARLFAKSLNCTQLVDGEPCCQCESCVSISNGNSLDVIEIDGASNNGVDNIRDLRDSAQYTPSSGNYKIYIIDEVHMLSNAAWNALLKTLEEPPPHVKFIFATTESHKVLPTVVSRCQRFDFKVIPPLLISQKLREIADSEKIFITDAALGTIARAADGGMRDAQSIFDQMIAFCGGSNETETIQEKDVIDVFGLASTEDLSSLVYYMFTEKVSDLLLTLHNLAGEGRDLERLFTDLLNFLRNLTIVQYCHNAVDILAIDKIELERLERLKEFPVTMTQEFLQTLMLAEGRLRLALNKRAFLETNLIIAIKEAHSADLNDVIAGFEQLRNSEIPRQKFITVETQVIEKKTLIDEKPTSASAQPPSVEEMEPHCESSHSVVAEAPSLEPSTEAPATSTIPVENSSPIAVVEPEPPIQEQPQDNLSEEPEVITTTPQAEQTFSSPIEPTSTTPTTTIDTAEPVIVAPVAEVVPPVQEEPISAPEAAMPSYAEPQQQISGTEPQFLPETSVETQIHYQENFEAPLPQTAADIWHGVIERFSHLEDAAIACRILKTISPMSFEESVFVVSINEDFLDEDKFFIENKQNIRRIEHVLAELTNSHKVELVFKSFADAVSYISDAAAEERARKNPLVQELCKRFDGDVFFAQG